MDLGNTKGLNVRRFGKASIIVYQGEIPREGFYVKEGLVRAYQIGSDGNTRTITFCGPGDVFPIAWLVGESNPAMYYYEAFTDCDLTLITKEWWNKAYSSTKFKDKYSAYVSKNYQSSLVRIAALEQPKAQAKILYTILYLLLRHSHKVVPDVYRIDMKLKHQDIAEMIGLTRETTAIELSKLQKDKILSYQNQKYLVKKSKLLAALNEDSLKQLEI